MVRLRRPGHRDCFSQRLPWTETRGTRTKRCLLPSPTPCPCSAQWPPAWCIPGSRPQWRTSPCRPRSRSSCTCERQRKPGRDTPKYSTLTRHRWYIYHHREGKKHSWAFLRPPIRREDHRNIWRSFSTENTCETKAGLMGHLTTNEWPKSDVTLSGMKNIPAVFLVSGRNLHESLKHSLSWHMPSCCERERVQFCGQISHRRAKSPQNVRHEMEEKYRSCQKERGGRHK